MPRGRPPIAGRTGEPVDAPSLHCIRVSVLPACARCEVTAAGMGVCLTVLVWYAHAHAHAHVLVLVLAYI